MTDRFSTLTVVLEKPIREDDAQNLIEAIQQMRGVLSVAGDVAEAGEYAAAQRVRSELQGKLWEVLYGSGG